MAELERESGCAEYRKRTGRMEKWRQLAIDAAKDKNLSDRIPDKLEQHGSSMVSFFLNGFVS